VCRARRERILCSTNTPRNSPQVTTPIHCDSFPLRIKTFSALPAGAPPPPQQPIDRVTIDELWRVEPELSTFDGPKSYLISYPAGCIVVLPGDRPFSFQARPFYSLRKRQGIMPISKTCSYHELNPHQSADFELILKLMLQCVGIFEKFSIFFNTYFF